MNEPRSIVAFRNGSIGNTLVAIPALRSIRARWPRALLVVVVDSTGFELLEHCPWIDHLVVYDKRGADRGLWAGIRLVRRLRTFRPTHAVLFKRFFRNGLLAYCSGASERLGFRTHGRAPFLTQTVDYDNLLPVLQLNLQLAALLDATQTNQKTELFLSEVDRAQARTWLAEQQLTGQLAIIHYGGLTTRPDFIEPERMAALVQSLFPAHSLIFIGRGQAELSAAQNLMSRCGRGVSAMNLPLRVTAHLLELADFFLGMNSGPAHLAAAAGVRGAVLYPETDDIATELRRWKPASPALMQVVVPATVDSSALNKVRAEIAAQLNTDFRAQ